jgi:dipeptidyl aminopeptidase/acylaminoacyl peptidase
MTVTTASGTQRGRIDLDELAHLPNFYIPTTSWQRDRIAYYGDRTGRLELYVMDPATRETRQVSHGEVPRTLRTFFQWDRAGRRIYFGRDSGGDEQHDLFVIDVETSEVRQLTSGGLAEHHVTEVSPDDRWLLVTANRPRPEAPDTPAQLNLWRLRLETGDLEPITDLPSPTFGGKWSPDGSWVSFNANEELGDLKNYDGYIVRPDGSGLRRVLRTRVGAKDFIADWHPDGRRLAVNSDETGGFRTGILDLATGALRWLSTGDIEEHALEFSDDGRWLAGYANRDAQIQPVLYEVETGQRRELTLTPGLGYGGQFFDGGRRLLVNYATDRTRTALLAYDLETDAYEILIAPEYGSIDPSILIGTEHVRYPSFDGMQIPALLYTPSGIAAGERLPAIVIVHGGPTAQWFRQFDPYAQFLADRGYVVLEPNIRGSTGYGVAFRDAARKDWGGADLEDVAAGAKYLASLSHVDPARIAVFGGSYGGFMTFIAATKKPDVWKAAVAWVGISDLHRMWDESKEHFRYFLREQMGDPEMDRALWRDRSAIEFAHQLKARLLMIHGANDPRCPISQSRIFRDRLVELGKREGTDFEYVEYGDEGHGSADPEQKVRTYKILADFLDRAL